MTQLSREDYIQFIESTWPPDAAETVRRGIGQRLLKQAQEACADWRNEPTDVLAHLAGLCSDRQRLCEATRDRLRHSITKMRS